ADPGDGDWLVGIAVIDEPRMVEAWNLTESLARTGMEWVAVATPAVIHSPGLAGTLAGAFFDFHTLPLDEMRLLHSLGHAWGKAMLRRQAANAPGCERGQFGM